MEDILQTEKIKELEKAVQTLIIRQDDAEKDMQRNYVSYQQFWWTVGVLMTVVGGMFYLVYSRQENMQSQLIDIMKNTQETKQNVSFIQGLLNKADITK